MSRSAALALLILAAAGCNQEPHNVIVARPPQPAAPAAPAAAAAPQTVIDDEVVRRFVDFDKHYLAALPARMAQMRDQLAAVEKGGGKGAGSPGEGAAHDVLQRMNAEDAKLRAAAGLTQEQGQAMQDLSMAIASARKSGAELKTRIDKARAGLSGVPAEQKKSLEAELQSLERRAREVQSLQGARRRFGDAAVDTAMRHQAELAPLWDQQMDVFQQAMKLMATGK